MRIPREIQLANLAIWRFAPLSERHWGWACRTRAVAKQPQIRGWLAIACGFLCSSSRLPGCFRDPSLERGLERFSSRTQARDRDLVAAAFGRTAFGREARGFGSSTGSSSSTTFAFTARAIAAAEETEAAEEAGAAAGG